MNKKRYFLLFWLMIFFSCSSQAPHTLFSDALDDKSINDNWRIKPNNFTILQDSSTVYSLKPMQPDSNFILPWVGDSTWSNYRIEVEMLYPDSIRSGFVGIDYYIQPDGISSCNLGLFVGGDSTTVRHFETSAHFGKTNTCWKLWPLSQKPIPMINNNWMKWRLDIGTDVINVFVNNDSTPVYTSYNLPYSSGGVRFWQYYGAAYIKNFKITKLEHSVEPVLKDTWSKIDPQKSIKQWNISSVITDPEFTFSPKNDTQIKWQAVQPDKQGRINLSAHFPGLIKGKIIGQTTILSDSAVKQKIFLSYTDKLKLFCNEKLIFDRPSRGWNDPGRNFQEGFGRLLPDLFQTTLSLKKGKNLVQIEMDIKEPEFGSGFWMRKN